MSFFHKSGIVNVKMVITEEKIISNIDKIQKLINPNSKKQIVQLEEDSYFKDLVESVKTYLIEYPKKKNFPRNIYKASYELVEYATNQFEDNTKKVEELIRQREKNIKLASVLRDATTAVKARAKNWKEIVKKLESKYPADVVEALNIIGKTKDKESEEYTGAIKLIEAKVNNLESNLHIEIDMERIEDRSKALSFIGIEIAEALKYIPAPMEELGGVSVTEKAGSIADMIEQEPTEKIEEIETATVTETETPAGDEETETTGTVESEDQAPVVEAKEENVVETPVENIETVEEAPVETAVEPEVEVEKPIEEAISEQEVEAAVAEMETYLEETTFEEKPSLWQKFKNSKFVRTLRAIMSIRIVIDYPPALPEGKGENE